MELLLVVAVLLGIYVISVALFPNRRCPRCRGTGQLRPGKLSLVSRTCGRCAGTGTVKRVGR